MRFFEAGKLHLYLVLFLFFFDLPLLRSQINLAYDASGNRVQISKGSTIPLASIKGDTAYCKGDKVVITASGGTRYRWSFSSMDSSLTFLADTTNLYWVDITNYLNCTIRKNIQIIVKPNPPKPSISKQDKDLISSSQIGNQWYRNDTSIQGATNFLYRPNVNGAYSVRTSIEGCLSPFSDQLSLTFPRIVSLDIWNDLLLYPNPVLDILNIDNKNNRDLHFYLFNESGQFISEYSLQNKNGRLSFETLSSGWYLLKIIDARVDQIVLYKVIKN
jgi:hypothetical protein